MSGPMQWTPGGMVPTLASALGISAPSPTYTAVDEDDDEDQGETNDIPSARAAAVPASSPKGKRASSRSPLPPPPNVLKLARARLRAVESEIRRLKKLEAERDELRRLIDAATNKPRAVVRELPTKRTAG